MITILTHGDVDEIPYLVRYTVRGIEFGCQWRYVDHPSWFARVMPRGNSERLPTVPRHITEQGRDEVLKHFGLYDHRLLFPLHILIGKPPVYLMRARRLFEKRQCLLRHEAFSMDQNNMISAMFVS